MIGKLLLQTFVSCCCIAVILFLAAGTMNWPAAWALVVEIGIGSLLLGLWLAYADPVLLAERLRSPVQRDQRTWDKALLALLVVALVGWCVLMGLDSVRYDWSVVPSGLRLLGSLGPIASYLITFAAFRANSYASPVVKIDGKRGQQVATFGPYAVVRHPMYAGALLFLTGMPLLLGSWWGLLCVPLLGLGLALRAVLEERELLTGLEGYAKYATGVRFRMIPGFW